LAGAEAGFDSDESDLADPVDDDSLVDPLFVSPFVEADESTLPLFLA
jgi:hypothetical protein